MILTRCRRNSAGGGPASLRSGGGRVKRNPVYVQAPRPSRCGRQTPMCPRSRRRPVGRANRSRRRPVGRRAGHGDVRKVGRTGRVAARKPGAQVGFAGLLVGFDGDHGAHIARSRCCIRPRSPDRAWQDARSADPGRQPSTPLEELDDLTTLQRHRGRPCRSCRRVVRVRPSGAAAARPAVVGSRRVRRRPVESLYAFARGPTLSLDSC
jgi:hypothetical protein